MRCFGSGGRSEDLSPLSLAKGEVRERLSEVFWEDRAVKRCEGCDGWIPYRKNEGPARYAKRRFCSSSCHLATESSPFSLYLADIYRVYQERGTRNPAPMLHEAVTEVHVELDYIRAQRGLAPLDWNGNWRRKPEWV